MSKIDQLIEDLCPNGVSTYKLEDVILSLKTGLNPRKNFRLNEAEASNYYVTIREIVNGKIVISSKTDKVTDEGLRLINNRSNLEEGDILFSGTGTIGRTAVVTETPKNWNVKEGVYCIKPDQTKITPKFFMYLLSSPKIRIDYESKVVGGTVSSIPMGVLKQTILPVPPLEVQKEIVNILDKFTQLEAELSAELEARRDQYKYYRDSLLEPNVGEAWKMLGDVCEVGDGNHSSNYPKASEMVEHGVSFIRGTNIVDGTISDQDMKYISIDKHLKLKKGHLKANDVLITNRGEVGKIAIIPKEFDNSNLNSQIAWLRADDQSLIPKYLFFILNASFIQNKIIGEGGALQQLTIKNIKLLKIPVPPLMKQEEIVNILDKFDLLTNDITVGLPAEIKARRQQYEYYRTKLLTFQELPA